MATKKAHDQPRRAVFIVQWHHKHGDDFGVYDTLDNARKGALGIAARIREEEWGHPLPEDDVELLDNLPEHTREDMWVEIRLVHPENYQW